MLFIQVKSSGAMDHQLKNILLSSTNSSSIEKIELIQKLWSGYGSLNRIFLNDQSVILKLIKFPNASNHPRGWNTNLSHQRKARSYKVEMGWYQNYSQPIIHVKIPRLIQQGGLKSNEKFLILEDLSNAGYSPKSTINTSQVKLCLKWLANFHSHYLNAEPKHLWPIGTYWHLETRPEELRAMEDDKLKKAAHIIDQKLNSSKYKTIVHGDAKIANFLFKEKEVAAVDFQYVGGGVGVKDVAYFLSSIYNEDELQKKESWCLDNYFKELANPEVEKEWRELYPYVWCDFYRFLKGWSPGHYKLNSYSEQMKNRVLEWI
ncbi:MAG: phosphotransferase [Bdellovibrionota bacterium]|nr:phosphotransferase [Bdellovibrionota bacterium]